MLGFAIVDRQPKADATAVWLTSRERSRVSHTNAVVFSNDDDAYEIKLWNLTANRTVVLTQGSRPPRAFHHALSVDAFEGFSEETEAHQQRIERAVSDYAAQMKNRKFAAPEFPRTRPTLVVDPRDQPEFRALSTANYIAAVWTMWLVTDEQRARRTIDPRTGKPPWIMPEDLGNPELAEFPPGFSVGVQPEPMTGRPAP